jgi:type IV secretory pathway TraG/TraD family ATPase VirD4
MKVNPAPLNLAQTALTGLVIVFSLAVLGTSAHTLDVFNKQQTSNPWWLPLWPQHFDVHGTKALIASSVIALTLSSAFLIATFLPSVSLLHHPNSTSMSQD